MADTANARAGTLKIMAHSPARNATNMPTMRKPPMKLKSLRVLKA